MPAPKNLRNCLIAAAIASTALLALPALSQAATTFGSRLNHDPANSGECDMLPTPCTLVSFIVPTDPNGDPSSEGSPSDGVIVKFRTRVEGLGASPATITFRLVNINRPDPNNQDVAQATAVATGPTVVAQPGDGITTPIREFAARVPVKKGNHLAIDGTNVFGTVNNSGNKFTYLYAPPLVDGQAPRNNSDTKGELNVAAVVEPDADGDGFGDETQDQCPRQKTTQGACDDTKPVASGGSFNPKAFGPLPSGNSIARKKKKVKRGSTFSYTLSEAATVNFTVQRTIKGRKKGKKCKPKRKRGKRCKVTQTLSGGFSQAGKAGVNSFKFSGRLNNKKLRKGSYTLIATPTDVPGNVGVALRTGFRIR